MPAIKDLNQLVEYTTDNPFTNSSPTWVEVPACRLDGESDHPGSEPQGAALYDGRETSAGHQQSFTYIVRRDTASPDSVVDALITADNECQIVWVRETPLQSSAIPQVIGGRLGCTVMVGDSQQGFGGHKAKSVAFMATEAEAGQLIQDDPNFSESS